MTEASESVMVWAAPRRQAEEFALVLLAEGLAPTLGAEDGGRWSIRVPAAEAERAAATLSEYASERAAGARRAPAGWVGSGPTVAALASFGAVLAAFIVTGPATNRSPWAAAGAAQAGRLLDGEPWRALTALTLHVDAVHALANAGAGALFLGLAFRSLGPGLGLALVLLAGGLGNVCNAWLHPPTHVSVGASTAVFGAVGLLAGRAIPWRGRTWGRRRAWLPLAAGLALLALLGTGGERTDVWAHALGLAIGALLGLAWAALGRRPPGLAVQWALGGLGLAVLAGAWALAALRVQ